MERNTVTYINKLKVGDRFYRAGDKDRLVLEKVDHKVKRTNYQTYSHWAIPASIADRFRPDGEQLERQISLWGRALRAETQVVYLRSVEGVQS